MSQNQLDRLRSFSGDAFIAALQQAAVSAQFSCCQIFNPTGSGKLSIVSRVLVTSATAQKILIQGASALAATFLGFGANKFINKGGGVTKTAVETNASNTHNALSTMAYLAVPANGIAEIRFDEPIILQENIGLQAYTTVVNTDLSAVFDYDEG